MLDPVRQLSRSWEGDTIPTICNVVSGLYECIATITEFTSRRNKGKDVVFGRALVKNIQARFPDNLQREFVYAAGNYLHPYSRGDNLSKDRFLHETKDKLETLSNKFNPSTSPIEDVAAIDQVDMSTLSQNQKLKLKNRRSRVFREGTETSKFTRECEVYENLPDPNENVDVCAWWKHTAYQFPLLAQCARYILPIPASSATSERIFSAGSIL